MNLVDLRLCSLPALLLFGATLPATASPDSLDVILDRTRTLESQRDPKCEATAARLEDFIFGTPLSEEARHRKHALQTALVRRLWERASTIAGNAQRDRVSSDDVRAAAKAVLRIEPAAQNGWRVGAGERAVVIEARDFRQYSSVAYALRAVLAVQQEQMLAAVSSAGQAPLGELTPEAVDALKLHAELYTLAALSLADREARGADAYRISAVVLESAWSSVGEAPAVTSAAMPAIPAGAGYPTLMPLIENKLAAYAAYNRITTPVFVRNLQVYFARQRWPRDAREAEDFKALFTEVMIQFSRDFLLDVEAIARKADAPLIRPEHIARHARRFLPHEVNEYEDVIFFPQLAGDRLLIEAYDLDSFRDPGLHWQYLRQAAVDLEPEGRIEPDPFAAELIVENIAQFGVLLLRVAGEQSRRAGRDTLARADLESGMAEIQRRVDAHAALGSAPPAEPVIASASGGGGAAAFVDRTADSGIAFAHRTSDWLSRRIRTYTRTGADVANLTIPPAFGGSGVAAEDIDNDGRPDILLLGGAGNRLYLNDGQGRFRDVTTDMGLDWRREDDGLAGEVRQPIIADLDNDGWQDIVITYVDDTHRVYRNVRGERFEDVTERAGLGGPGDVGGPATVADIDNDGILDLYIGNFGNYLRGDLPTLARRNVNGAGNRLFRGLGDFRFEDITDRAGIAGSGWTQAVGHTDFDGDGLQDLIEGNDFGVNVYYRNLGNGRFEDVTAQLGTGKPSYTMNIGLADLNADDRPDIYISNIVTMNKDEKYVLPDDRTTMKLNPDKLAQMRVVEANDLFLSAGSGDEAMPRYVASDRVGRGYASTGWSWDADFFDFDNDGDDDLYVTNGMNEFNVYSTENAYYRDPDGDAQDVRFAAPNRDANVLFANEGGRLRNVTRGSGLDLVGNSRSAAYLDHDGDGDLDVILNNYHEPAVLFENRLSGDSTHWLAVQLEGDPEAGVSRDAIGARMVATTASTRVWREVHGTTGYLSVHPKEQHFGLGKDTSAALEIRWPNGQIQKVDELRAGGRYLIRYGDRPVKLPTPAAEESE
ncbi:MAG: CRTAC1 family protein [Sinimarinibacterium flocculans]|uniref:CRTAC1 family protein n=1 Tax=Sinimarinibacterium flocculans TaxID=985250 RepID=UPI003C41550E